MKTTDLRIGASYRMRDNQECTVVKIIGRGRNRAVKTEPALRTVGINRHWLSIRDFAARVIEEIPSAEANA